MTNIDKKNSIESDEVGEQQDEGLNSLKSFVDGLKNSYKNFINYYTKHNQSDQIDSFNNQVYQELMKHREQMGDLSILLIPNYKLIKKYMQEHPIDPKVKDEKLQKIMDNT